MEQESAVDPENADVNLGINKNIIVYYRMASFLAKRAAAQALKKAGPIINKTANNIKAAGKKTLQQHQKCTIEFQKCVKTESTKMKQELGGLLKKAGTNMQSGGRKRRSRKRKHSRTKKHRRRGSKRRGSKRRRSRKRRRR